MDPLVSMISSSEHHEDYSEGSNFYIENYLNNSLGQKNKNTSALGHKRKNGSIVDRSTEYSTNNFGYRDENWEEVANILAAGCSNTYGLGIPINGTWPKFLEVLTNQKVHNISKPGMSIQELVFQIFAYFKTFGNPNTLICLFPDPFRMQLPVKKNLITVGNQTINNPISDVHLQNKTNTKISDRKKYLKIPYDYRDILPMETPLFFSIKLIHMLEQYCNSNDINFVWSSWDINFRNVLNKTETEFSNFYDSNDFNMGTLLEKNCHSSYRDMFLQYFDIGQDIEDGEEYAHSGVHRQIHIAESFFKGLSQ
jgi:hypothetical protein